MKWRRENARNWRHVPTRSLVHLGPDGLWYAYRSNLTRIAPDGFLTRAKAMGAVEAMG